MLCSRDVFEKIDGFDEDYPLYYEDTDICYRIYKSGKKVYFFSDASIIHYGNQSGIQRFGDQTVLMYYKAKHLFLKKHYTLPTRLLHRILMSVLLTWRLIVSFISDPRQKTTDRKFLLLGIGIQWGIDRERNAGRAGVVHQDVHGTQLCPHPLEGPRDGGLVGDVEADGERSAAGPDLPGNGGNLLARAGGDGDGGALAGEEAGRGGADAASPSRDKGHPARMCACLHGHHYTGRAAPARRR